MASFVGHVQISQTPNRNCPMSEDGEVNHRYFLTKLIAPFYQDFIGLEYNGKGDKYFEIYYFCFIDSSESSFEWLNEFSSIK
jgi:hydroxypyruvate isomerase